MKANADQDRERHRKRLVDMALVLAILTGEDQSTTEIAREFAERYIPDHRGHVPHEAVRYALRDLQRLQIVAEIGEPVSGRPLIWRMLRG